MDEKLKQFNKFMAAMDTSAMSAEEITKGFEAIIKHVEENKKITQKQIEAIRIAYEDMLSQRDKSQKDYSADFDNLKSKLDGAIEKKLRSLKNGIDGRDGIDGKDGKDGVDGLNGLDGMPGRDGKDGKDGTSGQAKAGWGAHPLQIRDGTTVIDKVARVINFGTNLTATRSTDGIVTVNASGGGGFTELTATGTVNGVNVTFTFTQTPTYICADHAWYKSTNSSGTINWSGTTTVTMTIPPTEDIFGVA